MSRLAAARALASLLAATALLSAAPGAAQRLDPLTEAKKSFVRIKVSSKIVDDQVPDAGSGVLVSYHGHVLTAGHVVEDAVDEISTGHEVFMIPGARVTAQFLNDADELDPTVYEASIVYYSRDPDVALLKLEVADYAFATRPLPVLDPLSAHENCVGCFIILGYTTRNFESVPGTPGQAVGGNYKRMLTSNMTFGYSGGPVYRTGLDAWTLVGIGISGDKVQQATNFIVTLHAAQSALAPIQDDLVLKERCEMKCTFPSQRFRDWAGFDVVAASAADLTTFAERRLQTDARGFVRRLLEEEFYGVALDNKSQANAAKALLEHTLNAMYRQRGTTDPTLFTLLVEKLVTLYGLLGEDRLIIARWREDLLVQSAYCDHLATGGSTSGLHRCWQRLDTKQQHLVVQIVRRAFNDAVTRYAQQRRDEAAVLTLSTVQLEQLIEWGDFLSRIGAIPVAETLQQALRVFVPFALDPTRIPPGPPGRYPRAVFRAAAVDKYDEARGVLAVIERQQKLKTAFTRLAEFRKKVCANIRREIVELRSLMAGEAYALQLERKLTTEISPYCSPP